MSRVISIFRQMATELPLGPGYYDAKRQIRRKAPLIIEAG
jgi:hypothetical protein